MPGPRFKTKVDWWIGILVSLPAVMVPLALFEDWSAAGLTLSNVLPLVLLVGIYGGLLFPMVYEVADEGLIVRFGLARSVIRYDTIIRVIPTRNPISSPAMSLDRLHIDSGNALGPNLSPADRAGFLAALAKHTPHLELRGGCLLPPEP